MHAPFDGGYNFPGGAKGAIESKPIDLRNYSADDLPMLYFNYYLSTENRNANGNADQDYMRDSFRVYATGDGTSWALLATNNSSNDSRNGLATWVDGADEYDNVANNNYRDAFGNRILPQELFDVNDTGANTNNVVTNQPARHTDGWRQARLNLAPFAGLNGVRLRFEFATGATFNTSSAYLGGNELSAVPAHQLADGNTFTVTPVDLGSTPARTFEFDLGLVLNLPGGSSIANGSTLKIDNRTYTFSTGARLPTQSSIRLVTRHRPWLTKF